MRNAASRLIRLADIAPMPWKNGGGVTREIAAGPSPDGEGWGWRVSLAEVAQDGPFSIFPNVDRVIAVIAGAGMDLIAPDGTSVPLEPFQPVAFSGDEALIGRLRGGPVRDLNVMVLRAHYEAGMEVLDGPQSVDARTGSGDCLLVHSLAGRCTVRVDGGGVQDLMPGDSLLHEGRGSVATELAADGRVAVILIRRRET